MSRIYSLKVKPCTVIRETILLAVEATPLMRHLIENFVVSDEDIAQRRSMPDGL